MKTVFFAVTALVLGCAHASRSVPETRPASVAPKTASASGESAPESGRAFADSTGTNAFLQIVRENARAIIAGLPEKNICGTPEFAAMNSALGTKGAETMMLLGILESAVESAGKDIPPEREVLIAALDRFRTSCPDTEALCASPDSELGCYEIYKTIFVAARAYAEALVAALR